VKRFIPSSRNQFSKTLAIFKRYGKKLKYNSIYLESPGPGTYILPSDFGVILPSEVKLKSSTRAQTPAIG